MSERADFPFDVLAFDPSEIQATLLPTATPNDSLVIQDVNRVVEDYLSRGSVVFNEIKAAAGDRFQEHHLYFIEGGPYYQFGFPSTLFRAYLPYTIFFHALDTQPVTLLSSFLPGFLCGACFAPSKDSLLLGETRLGWLTCRKPFSSQKAWFK